MGDKCVWKDGKFYPCDSFEPTSNHGDKSVYCIYCDTDIKKPEPEEKPLIAKSGKTWVARYEGVDYLCLRPDFYSLAGIRSDLFENILSEHPYYWKSFSEIEKEGLTDGIAILRPMMKNCEYRERLLAIIDGDLHTETTRDPIEDTRWSLATPHELEVHNETHL